MEVGGIQKIESLAEIFLQKKVGDGRTLENVLACSRGLKG